MTNKSTTYIFRHELQITLYHFSQGRQLIHHETTCEKIELANMLGIFLFIIFGAAFFRY